MTLKTFALLLRRRWYVMILAAVVTVATSLLLSSSPGTYWGRATVVFTPPINPERIGNVLEGSDPSLIYFAAAVEKTVEAGRPEVPLSSNAAALYGTGVSEGHSITLINTGGQWQSNYNRPMLIIEVVAPTPDAAQLDLDTTVGQVETTARQMQLDAGTQSSKLIDTEVSPQTPQVSFVPGNRARGLAAVLALGLAIGLAASVAIDRLLARSGAGGRRAERSELSTTTSV